MTGVWIAVIIQALICSYICNEIAIRKGYASSYALWGFFLGVLGLLFVIGLPQRSIEEMSPENMKVCPDCAEQIKVAAVICRYCGKKFDETLIISKITDNLLSDRANIRTQALEALQAIDDPSIIQHLLNFVENLDVSNNMYKDEIHDCITSLRMAMQILINKCTPAIAGKVATIAIETGNNHKHKAIIEALAFMEEPEAIPALIDAINRPNSREVVVKALINFGEQALPALEEKAIYGSKKEKAIAESIIEKIMVNR